MSFPITITFANPPEGTCPATFADAVVLLQALVGGEVTTTFTPYVLGANTPAVEDQDKAWIRLDAAGRPLGTFVFYAGNWRRQYTGKVKEITWFSGDPNTYFDGTGKGLATAEWDGWALCNGANGTPNMTDRFIASAHMDNSGGHDAYDGQWKTLWNGSMFNTGGIDTYLIKQQDLPELALQLDGHDYNPGGSPHVDPSLIIDKLYVNAAPESVTVAHYGFNSSSQSQTSFPVLPKFYSAAPCLFIGYS